MDSSINKPSRTEAAIIRRYKVEFSPLEKGGLQTCKPCSCICCGDAISGGGGGGEYICDRCHEIMRGRVLQMFFRFASDYGDDIKSSLSTIMEALRGYEDEHVRN
jgi:hypothetical protein